jgi:hypothetical protein
MHGVEFLFEEKAKLDFFFMFLEVLLILLHDLISPFFFLFFGLDKLITLLSKLSSLSLVLCLTELETFDLRLVLLLQLVNFLLVFMFH